MRGVVALAEALAAVGLVDEALDRAREAFDAGLADAKLIRRVAAVAEAMGDPELAARCWAALSGLQPWQPKWPIQLAMAAVERADYQEAYRIVREGLEVWPNDPVLRRLALTNGCLSGRSNSVEADAVALAADDTATPRARLDAARHLIGRGMTSEAAPTLVALMAQAEDPDTAHAAAAELRAIEILDAAGPQIACAVPGQLGMGRPAVFHRAPGAEATAIIFMGLAGKLGVTVNVVHALIAPFGVNILYLFDEDRVTHLNGNRAFGRNYDDTLERMRDMLDAWGTRRLVCVGSSAGGSAAIRYGLDLGAQHVVSFGGATTLDPRAIWDQGRARAVVSRMKRLVPHMLTDLKPMLERARPSPRLDLYYCAGMDGDRIYAEHLAGLPNVQLHPVEGSARHDVICELVQQRDLAQIFRKIFDAAPALTPAAPPHKRLQRAC